MTIRKKSTIRHRQPARGFTLLEVLVAIGLVLLLGGALFGFLHDMLSTRARTLRYAAQHRAAATLIDRLEADIITTFVGDRAGGPGVLGESTRLRLLTRGVMTQLASRGLEDPDALGDLQAVEYRFDPAARRLEARRTPPTRPGSAPGDGEASPSAPFASLGGAIAHVRFRYLDERHWRDSFDSLALGRLPQAIEVAVWFNPWPQDQVADDGSATPDNSVNFDERAYVLSSDPESNRLPAPDRMRVIVIPDGGGEEAADE